MVREQSFFMELLNRINYQQSVLQTGGINLGGTSGSGGGSGAPPGSFYGQLPQSRVAGDTTESFDYTSGSAVSLLSNLNNLRAYAEPATWFFAHETIPASQALTIMPGLWHFSSGSVLQTAAQDYTFVPPVSDNRIDLLYVHTSGVYDVIRGTAAVTPVSPSIPAPTSGSMPLAYIYLRSSGSAVHNIDRGENYVLQDLRPFLAWGLAGAGGGSVLLDPSTPQAVGAAGAVGTSGSASHGDHVHQGVSSVSAAGGAYAYGNIQIVPGTNISVSQSSGSITVNSTVAAGGVVFDTANPQDVGSAASVGTSGSPPHADHVHRGVSSVSAAGGSYAYGNIQFLPGSNVTLSQSSGSITIAASSGSGGGISTYESAYASPPGGPVSGDIWYITDGDLHARHNGSAWSYYYGTRKVTKPVLSDFTTWFNQGSATLDDYGDLILYTPPTNSTNIRGKVYTAPATTYTIDAIIIPGISNIGWFGCGVCWSDGTKYVSFGVTNVSGNTGNPSLEVTKWNTTTSWSARYTPSPDTLGVEPWRSFPYTPLWLRIVEDASNRTCYTSFDWGKHFIQIHQVGRTDFLTATQVGIMVYNENASYGTTMSLLSWATS